MLAIDQDSLGKQATQIVNDAGSVIYSKTLEDGSTAVGLFNRGEVETTITVSWGVWGNLSNGGGGKRLVRDPWRQKDLGVFEKQFSAKVSPHGVVLVRVIASP